jgi:PAS domain-containing protein
VEALYGRSADECTGHVEHTPGHQAPARDEAVPREGAETFRQVVADVVDYATFLLSPDGIVTTWNAGAEHIRGHTSDEIVGENFERFYTPADRARGWA